METLKNMTNTIAELITEHQTALMGMLAVALTIGVTSVAQAMVAPATGDFGYIAYDVTFNQILNGPGGWVVGGAGLGLSGWAAVQQKALPAVAAAVGTGMILKLEDMLTSFGMLLN